ncbi:MAG TPA: lysophospholipid acyltransferase family protein [Pirellulaceae bacterium]|nr:lysophospholipid acyltransferase family protein [Pirellulaceae bacterium]
MFDFARQIYHRAAGLGATTLISRWMETLEYKAAFYERAADPAHPDFQGPAIFVFWHEYIPFLFYTRAFCNIAMLVSAHKDAEILSQAARFQGFATVRGSTQRGGGTALRDLQRKGQTMNLAITPDGPRGPRRRLAPGAIYLASKLQLPIVPIGLGYDRPWRMPTWDRFAVPKLYSRARAITGPPMRLPEHLDREGVEHYRQQVETMLTTLTDLSEEWAQSGGEMAGAIATGRRHAKRLRAVAPLPSLAILAGSERQAA